MVKEMFYFGLEMFAEIAYIVYVSKFRVDFCGRYCDYLVVYSAFIFHFQHSYGACRAESSRGKGSGSYKKNIERVAVFGVRVRDESVIERISHRGIQKP